MGAARRLLSARRADVVLGGGGYVGGPGGPGGGPDGRCRWCSPRPTATSGLANRLLARRARRVCLAFPIPGRDGGPYVVTGRPVPRAVLEADPTVARRRFGIPEPADCVTIVGGSLGARSINLAAFDAFTRLDGACRTTTSASRGSSTSPAAATTRSCGGAGTSRAVPSATR